MSRLRGLIKYLTIAAMGILLLLFVFWGFLKYQDHASYKNVVHQDAELIIRIDRNQLIRKIGLNALTNPGYYFRADEDDSLDIEEEESLGNGFDTKANIFIYSLKEAPLTFYSTFEVTDTAALKAFLKNKLSIAEFVDNTAYTYGHAFGGKLLAAYNNSSLVVVYSFDKTHSQRAIEDIISKKRFLKPNHPLLDGLKEYDDDVVLMSDGHVGRLSFDNGKIVLAAALQMQDYFKIPDQPVVAGWDTRSAFQLSLSGDISPVIGRDYMVNEINIPLDSILYHYHGYLDFAISGSTVQSDTIITYEYNDDFEKIETKSLREKEVPGVKLRLKGDAAEIRRLLERENVIHNDRLNSSLFPLLNLTFSEINAGTIQISNLDADNIADVADSESFVSLFTDLRKLKEESAVPIPERYLEDIDRLEINASKSDEKIAVKGEVLLTNSQINALVQLLE